MGRGGVGLGQAGHPFLWPNLPTSSSSTVEDSWHTGLFPTSFPSSSCTLSPTPKHTHPSGLGQILSLYKLQLRAAWQRMPVPFTSPSITTAESCSTWAASTIQCFGIISFFPFESAVRPPGDMVLSPYILLKWGYLMCRQMTWEMVDRRGGRGQGVEQGRKGKRILCASHRPGMTSAFHSHW